MANLRKGAQGALAAVKVARSGDIQTAASQIEAAAGKIDAGSKALDAGVQDMQTFTGNG